MTIENATKVILDNYFCNENSLVYYLHENSYFSNEKFWEFYESITAFASKEKDVEITRKITSIYQKILKELIYHFDPIDASVLANFPENYNDYIERLDLALLAYYTDNVDLLD